ncbi:MAG: PINc/VapC family ATPase [Thermoplasmatota archaeon]|nr:PINc/VapC family ATPase [Halobacteriales archaeon]
MPETLVPDTSVLVDGRITELLASGEFPKAKVLVPLAALAELESQANRGLETGVAGLDELAALQRLASEGRVTVEFTGTRPSSDEVERAKRGAIDALIRDTAIAAEGILVTADRVQAHAAAAQGVRHHYLRPIVKDLDLTGLKLWGFFDAQTMSVHLKADCVPMVKKGMPGQVSYEPFGGQRREMTHQELRAIAKECIEFTKRDYNSFMEMEKHGCTVIQLGPMRITIAQPPFADGLEITAVRPVTKKLLSDYELEPFLLQRLEGRSRGVFVAGPPGSGKSTFAAAVAEHLHGLKRVVKTMEQPRDLQVPKEVTQFGALDRDMKWTGEVMLLVRPDNVIYDEVRTTDDFLTFADMRLAGVGLIGVTHANRAIDAVQRLIGRVELGMIPQVVDTVLFVDAGKIAQVLELEFTVKVPDGMTMEDLARPVVVVKDVMAGGRPVYELYTFGEQVVVMPLDRDGQGEARNPAANLAEKELTRALRKYVNGPMEIKVRGSKATVYVDESEVPAVIGKGGRTVQMLEGKVGIGLDIKALPARAARRPAYNPSDEEYHAQMRQAREAARGRDGEDEGGVKVKSSGSNVFVLLDDYEGGATYTVMVGDATVGEAVASQKGQLRFKRTTPEGQALHDAARQGLPVTVARS